VTAIVNADIGASAAIVGSKLNLAAPGAIGGTTPSAGAFTTLIGTNVDGIIGANTPAAGAFTTISASGLITATGGQIAFPATAVPSADANTLDDYEEGTWTVGISFAGGTTGITYNASYGTGAYTKVGNMVTIWGLCVLSNKGSDTGVARITGLPFTPINDYKGYGSVSLITTNIAFADMMQAQIDKGAATIAFCEVSNAGVNTYLTDTEFENNSNFAFNGSYMIAN